MLSGSGASTRGSHHGRNRLESARLLRQRLAAEAPELRVIEPDLLASTPGVTGVDPTHVLIGTASIGLTGYRAAGGFFQGASDPTLRKLRVVAS